MLTTLQTQPKKRLTPYAWVTTIAQLMAEEKPCYYAPWLRTQYHIPTSPSDYDSTNHDEMLIQRAVELQNQEHQITVENPNSIKVFGNKFKICIAGRPDIIAIKNDWVIVEDCKSGKKRKSHRYQVLLYMLLLRHADNTKEQCKNRQLLGRLIYPDETEDISSIYLDQTFLDKLHQTLKILTSLEIPTPQANQWNCRYCTIPDQYCSLKKSA